MAGNVNENRLKIGFLILFGVIIGYNFTLFSETKDCLSLLDLDMSGLAEVKRLYSQGKRGESLSALKDYYLSRQNVRFLDEYDLCNNIYESQKTSAKNALDHKFTVLSNYGPIDYGMDIDWEYWPVKDLELRWQLHRMYWWTALGKAYRHFSDERYAEEWVAEYKDWIEKNPLNDYDYKKVRSWITAENQYFAWRPIETGIRLKSQIENFIQMRDAECFTPEFLDTFLVNYHRHMQHLHNNYTPSCNHRLTEAQGMMYATVFFPEFRDSEAYREKAVEILNEEINKQVYDDGMQIELDPSYHFGAINTFFDVLRLCSLNNIADVFPTSFMKKIGGMIDIARRFIYPDSTMTLFSDSRQLSKGTLSKYLTDWSQVFPEDDRNAGSKSYPNSGFYFLCNGWDMNSTIMAVKAGPPAFYHCQPDNGTFEYWRKGRNFFPDSGCYTYSGNDSINAMRDWFRQTKVHNTLTLDGKNLEKTNSELIEFKKTPDGTILKVRNQSYHDLSHDRQVFFANDGSVEIIDIATGEAEGTVQLNYNLSEGEWIASGNSLTSNYPDGNNISITVSSSSPIEMKSEVGRISRVYGEFSSRPAFSFNTSKSKDKTVIFKTRITPVAYNESPNSH